MLVNIYIYMITITKRKKLVKVEGKWRGYIKKRMAGVGEEGE